ncbi:LHFPL [Lepeophtheirus salmonis]|uniref:LHFPL n=2 Tax=Lepeophtheirus salmonis TaxID=72036 RepID=A0A7R8CIR9_LEPSM|nr:LHFPL tetraspan subfamily member 3 protein-like isoform X2 [Lepeophtheirus salmonis]CAB4058530.1 LHFPL [Lepeophtheirus salmonis]CAF2833969.1 LHFPL [Lepeophtheirus salmonis]
MDHNPTNPADNMTILTSKYIRNSRAIAVVWGTFTICIGILNIVILIQDQWVGDTSESRSPGHFGLWRFCTVLSDANTGEGSLVCKGRLDDFASILNPAFRTSTVFVGLSVIVTTLCVLAFLLFFFMKATSVFEICGTMQFLSGFCLAIGLVAFPAGWDDDEVRGICGSHSANYDLGGCGFRWAFILAIIVLFDILILGCLAFTLAHREIKLPPQESHYMNPASIYKGEINPGFVGDTQSIAGSRKSVNLQPVMMLPHPLHDVDGYSEFSHPRGRPMGGNPSTLYHRQ